MCELGCGPGLPSLTFADMVSRDGRRLGQLRVWATDLDEFALRLVEQAANDQSIALATQRFDLVQDQPLNLPKADLYLLADVFESTSVALGAAQCTANVLQNGASVWVFAQSDRVQRETYLHELRALLQDPLLAWQPMDQPPGDNKLWLCNVDETAVRYG